jgi:hypothetical protein
MDIQDIILDEISKVDTFIKETEIDLGFRPIDEDFEQDAIEYAEWYQNLDPIEKANIETKEVVNRFNSRLKNRVRKYTSGKG